MDPKTIAYSFLIGDLFHYGHLRLLQSAKESAVLHVCGVITDRAAKQWAAPLVCNQEERVAVIEKIVYVDEVMLQDSMDPTENLKRLHEKYPKAKILFYKSHQEWGDSPGVEFVKQIGGEVIRPEFYPRLSREDIIKTFVDKYSKKHGNETEDGRVAKKLDHKNYSKIISTKAETLSKLKPLLKNASIEKGLILTVAEWNKNQQKIVSQISRDFKGKIIVRSSSLTEDNLITSNAGAYKSVLNVNSQKSKQVSDAINTVIESYHNKNDRSENNQIFVQKQTESVAVSGVVFTKNLTSNTPYYLINYDDVTGNTDAITSGMTGKKIEILRNIPTEIISKKWTKLFAAIKELEALLPDLVLDIEFAITKNNKIVIFQVRPLAANSKFISLDDPLILSRVENLKKEHRSISASERSISGKPILSDMAFWNPAELIGDRPNYLDYSLFNHLLMKSNWNEGLTPLGYTKVGSGLMEFIANKPYINLDQGFLGLLPQSLPLRLKIKLLKHYKKVLLLHPELHDKIEFELVDNFYRLSFSKKRARELAEGGFTKKEIQTLKLALINITNNALKTFENIEKQDSQSIKELENRFEQIKQKTSKETGWQAKLDHIYRLIEDCNELGTAQFSRMARMAFMSKQILSDTSALCPDKNNSLDHFIKSISTVATEMDKDFTLLRSGKMQKSEFLNKYGHLRPDTYDITRLPYNKNTEYLRIDEADNIPPSKQEKETTTFDHNDDLANNISTLFEKNGFVVSGKNILDFIRQTTVLREYYKFIYTKNISLALELIATIGEELGFSREEMASLDYYSIVGNRENCTKEELINIWTNLIKARKEEKRVNDLISLPPLIFTENDFYLVESFASRPNFITDKIIEGNLVKLGTSGTVSGLEGKIVLLEKADPGYDWIFTNKIIGLVTKYGGAASHMSIRCAEFNIPAAIGCGDIIYSNLCKGDKILLDCKNKKINILK